MSDQFFNDIELPDLAVTPLPPDPGFISLYGLNGELMQLDSAGVEKPLVGGGGMTTFLNIDGGNSTTTFQNYVIRLDFGANGASINPTGTV